MTPDPGPEQTFRPKGQELLRLHFLGQPMIKDLKLHSSIPYE